MVTKRKLKLQLAEALFDLQIMRQDLKRTERKLLDNKVSLDQITEERDEYRTKYELLYHTPEFKAHTEAAFARGSIKMRKSIIAWLLETETTGSKWEVEDN
jgi:hypothetical protein